MRKILMASSKSNSKLPGLWGEIPSCMIEISSFENESKLPLNFLWGEVPKKKTEVQSEKTENAWKPHSNIWKRNCDQEVVMHERKFGITDRFSDTHFTDEKKDLQFCYDPIGQHIIKLRQHCYELSEVLNYKKKPEGETKESKRKSKDKIEEESKNIAESAELETREILPEISIPDFPVDYQSEDSYKSLSKIKHKNMKYSLQEDQIKTQLIDFVRKVVAQSGYYAERLQKISSSTVEQYPTSPVIYLSDLAHTFLEKFAESMARHKKSGVFSQCDNLWGPLETTLQQIGFDGINGLHEFYNENIVKRDVMLQKSVSMSELVKKIVSNV